MAIELFKPFVMKKLVSDGIAHNIKNAKHMIERLQPQVWDVLEEVIREHPVMLNRAPTLHRLGIQAFEPILVEGRAIKLHPLVCTAYNADFDGDQMAVHVPLTVEAQAECRFLLLAPNNLLKPSDGAPVAVPSQDMVLGTYYLTLRKDDELYSSEEEVGPLTDKDCVEILTKEDELYVWTKENVGSGKVFATEEEAKAAYDKGETIYIKKQIGSGKVFHDEKEALLAYDNKEITLHAPIKVRRSITIDGEVYTGITDATVGRIIYNEIIPQDLGFVNRKKEENKLKYEVDFLVGKKELGKIIKKCINTHGATDTAILLDNIKALGYKFSTRGSLTVSVSDMRVPPEKPMYLEEAQKEVDHVTKLFRRGLMTDEERYNKVIQAWNTANDKITKALLDNLGKYNNIYMMAHSGARGSNNQIKQLAGMRGLMASTSGRTIELPIKSNFREGLTVLEYFISAHGARKGLADTALRTADSGYLTRRLVDVSQDVIIREEDCHEHHPNDEIPGMWVFAYKDGA